MISQRLKQLRLARGFSLEALAAQLGGVITKQALSKYEQGKIQPSARILTKLAAALGVKAAHLFAEPDIEVNFIAYRKASKMTKRDQDHVESLVSHQLEERVRLQHLLYGSSGVDLPIGAFSISSIEAAEHAAMELRKRWDLGKDPIASLSGVLEDHFIHVLPIAAGKGFDGISAVAYAPEQEIVAAAAVTQSGVAGERQRLNLAHELGHLVLKLSDAVDEEKAAFRFGAAFLAPADVLFLEVGRHRTALNLEELLLLKQRFGMSIQALLYRLRDLGIIHDSYFRDWFIRLNGLGWRRQEPEELPAEQPQWLRQNVLRALSEKLLQHVEAEQLLQERIVIEQPLSLVERRAFMKLSLAERNRMLEEQAEKMVDFYEQDAEWRDLQGGDFLE
ncbi:helix-turn-helix domain-containing protein [Anthocerotibacter panamensis]|uniref:helix-turn-helix domain-containing protein n=1 Tax=Anthocerotibacter panamensis TaxID=2857077 RepID=UPI001C407A08|nr:XRE family transcriptional regulator [Anthocerotibacter panamensis]